MNESESELHAHAELHAERKRIARSTRRKILALITVLLVVLLALIFRIGQSWWPSWIMAGRGTLIGILGLVLIALLAAGPLIVEQSSNPRRLSGPGDLPSAYGGKQR